MRYQVKSINGNEAEGLLATAPLRDEHASLEWHGDHSAAKEAAEGIAMDYFYGTVVVDHQDEVIDWGDETTDFAGAVPA